MAGRVQFGHNFGIVRHLGFNWKWILTILPLLQIASHLYTKFQQNLTIRGCVINDFKKFPGPFF